MTIWTKTSDPFYRILDYTTSRFALLADDDGGQNGGGGAGGAGGNEPGGAPPAAGPDWGKFASSLEKLNTGNDGVANKLNELVDIVRSSQSGTDDGEPPPPDITAEDLEGMSRAELVQFIADRMSLSVDERLKNALTPVVNALQSLRTDTVTKDVTEQITSLKSSVKDFDEWKGDMAELAKVHSTLNIRQLYNLARAENSAKAAELDKKNAPPPKIAPPRFGGLSDRGTPLPASALKDARTSGKDATADALTEVAARHPVLAGLLNA